MGGATRVYSGCQMYRAHDRQFAGISGHELTGATPSVSSVKNRPPRCPFQPPAG